MKDICLITFIIYYLIATFIFCGCILDKFKMTLINKKTKEEEKPTIKFLFFYCWLWIVFLPLTKFEGEDNDGSNY